MNDSAPPLDERTATEIWRELRDRSRGYLKGSLPTGSSAGLGRVFARYLEAILQRLNQAPDKNRLAFFELLGLEPATAQSARAPIVFQLTAGAPDSEAPERTQVAAPPPPGATTPIVFETESALGIAAAKLTQVVSLWPGRDEYIDHTAVLSQGLPLTLFDSRSLQPTPHVLYLAHKTLLALAGKSSVGLEVTLAENGSDKLEVAWEYWDGKVWRGFQSNRTSCGETKENEPDNDGPSAIHAERNDHSSDRLCEDLHCRRQQRRVVLDPRAADADAAAQPGPTTADRREPESHDHDRQIAHDLRMVEYARAQ